MQEERLRQGLSTAWGLLFATPVKLNQLLLGGTAEKSLPSQTFVDPPTYLFNRKIISVPLSRCTLLSCELMTEAVAKVVVCKNKVRPGSPTTPWVLADKEAFTAAPGWSAVLTRVPVWCAEVLTTAARVERASARRTEPALAEAAGLRADWLLPIA